MIGPGDIIVSAFDPRPPPGGGQQVGVRTGIKIEHPESGITITVTGARSQHSAKLVALDGDGLLGELTSPHMR